MKGRKLSAYFVMLNLVVSMFAFSFGVGLVSAQGGTGGLYMYEGSPVVYQDLTSCEAEVPKDAMGKSTVDCIKVEIAGLELTDGIEKSILENQEFMSDTQRKEFTEKILKKSGLGDIEVVGDLSKYKIEKRGNDYFIMDISNPEGKGVDIKRMNLLKNAFGDITGLSLNTDKTAQINFIKDGVKSSVLYEPSKFKISVKGIEGLDTHPFTELGTLSGTSLAGTPVGIGELAGGFLDFKKLGMLAAVGIGIFMLMSEKGDKEVISEDGNVKVTLENNASIGISDEKGKEILIGQNDESQPTIIVSESSENHIVTNANIIVPEQVAAEIPSGETEIVLQGISGDSPNSVSETASGSPAWLVGNVVTPANDDGEGSNNVGSGDSEEIVTALLPLLDSPITGEVTGGFSRQSLELRGYNVDVSGYKINLYLLSSRDSVSLVGRNLELHSGIKFNIDNQRTYVSRIFSNVPHGINELTNKLDTNNEYELLSYNNQKGQLISYDGRITFGDFATKNPGEERLVIAFQRKGMYA